MVRKLENCSRYLKIRVAPHYTFGDFRKLISDAMDQVIEAKHIHLYDASPLEKTQRVLLWNQQWRTRSIRCQWDIVPFDSSKELTSSDGLRDGVLRVKVHLLTSTGYYEKTGGKQEQFITIRIGRNCMVKEVVKHIFESMCDPMVEYKYRDIVSFLGLKSVNREMDSVSGIDQRLNSFKVVLCTEGDGQIGNGNDKGLKALGMEEQFTRSDEMDIILPVHLLVIANPTRKLKENEVRLYLRFTTLSAGNGDVKYQDICCGVPVSIVVQCDESLQHIIDCGVLRQFGVSTVQSCYRIHVNQEGESTKTQIRRKSGKSGKTWDYYQPYLRFLRENPEDQLMMRVDNVNIASFGGKCVFGDCLFQ